MRKWTTDGSAEADTRVGRVERWLVVRGWMTLANLIADLRANLRTRLR